MTMSLSESKVTKIINACTTLRNLNRASIRQVAEVTGLLVATFLAVQYLQLFYRSVEACKSTRVSSGHLMRSLLALPTLRARIWIGLLRISEPITASRLEHLPFLIP